MPRVQNENHNQLFTVRLGEPLMTQFNDTAAALGISKTRLLRQLVKNSLTDNFVEQELQRRLKNWQQGQGQAA